jgi:hypothetical protein
LISPEFDPAQDELIRMAPRPEAKVRGQALF